MSAPLDPASISDLPVPADATISPNGSTIAWRVSLGGCERDGARGEIWVCDADEAAVRWTAGSNDSLPQWSPDGAELAFLSDRGGEGVNAVYVQRAGGEATKLYGADSSVNRFAWSPDGSRVAVLVAEQWPRSGERSSDERELSDDWTPNVLWVLDTRSGQVTPLTSPGSHVTSIAWAPDGARICVVAQSNVELDSGVDAWIDVVDVSTGMTTTVCTAPWAEEPGWLEDQDTIVFKAPIEVQPLAGATAWTVKAEAGALPSILGPGPDDAACVLTVQAVQPGHVLVTLAVGLETVFQRYEPATMEVEELARVAGDVRSFAASDSGAVVALAQMNSELLEVWSGRPENLVRRSSYGKLLAGVELGTVSSFVARGPEHWAIDVISIAPPARFGPAPHPTVVLPHGGPYGRSNLGMHCSPLDWGQLLATCGFHVLMPNYRGGLGKGHRFAAAARGDMGGAEWGDVEAAVDRAVELGLSDPDQLGLGGWSQGGFLTAWGVTQTGRYKAAVVGAGVSDWRSLILTTDKPLFEAALGGAFPWAPGEGTAPVLDDRSPITHAGNVRTPVLILQGENDERIPLVQATGLHRSLVASGAQAQLVIYPREPHVPAEREHQIDIMRRVRDWFLVHLTSPATGQPDASAASARSECRSR